MDNLRMYFILKNGEKKEVEAHAGLSILDIAKENDIDLEGACGGSLACSTCHIIIEDENFFHKLKPATENEEDMLDLAFGLEDYSRLGCQIIMTDELDGLTVKLPTATRNISSGSGS